MTLRDLLSEVDVIAVHGETEIPVSGLALDSREVRGGEVFFALSGLHRRGLEFVEQAMSNGAAAAVVPPGATCAVSPRVEVGDPRLALAQAAVRFHGHPSRDLDVVGITGTNGKTTITWMLESILRAAGKRAGIIGTTGYRIGDEARPALFTTPEAPTLQGLLREMVDRGVTAAALELSSHALVQRRCWGLACDVVVFTNLTQDHLDYHGTMDAYLDAKLMLFDGRNGTSSKPTVAVVNGGDPSAARVIEAARRGGLEVLTVGVDLEESRPPLGLDMQVEGIRPRRDGLELEARTGLPERLRSRGPRYRPAPKGGGEITFRVPLLGRYNAVNAILAWGAALLLDVDEGAIVRGLETLPAVPGRLERVGAGRPFDVVVDYAHTPDALARALAAVREHFAGRVLLVFGCGGDRDRSKRPLMGRAAAAGSDRAWVTNDNPRGEAPHAIAAEILAGAPAGALELELDRRAAIARALEAAAAGDVVLIAGKGHETTQIFGDRVLPFDDRTVARELLRARTGGGE